MPYAAPPAKTEISNTPSPSNAVAKAGFGKLWDFVTGLLGTSGAPDAALAALKVLDPQALYNLKLAFTLPGGSVLRATLTDKDGNALSADNPGFVAQRVSSLNDGAFNLRKIVAAITLDVSSGATLGHANGIAAALYWYLVEKDAATWKIAVCGSFLGFNGRFTTTLMSAAADSADILYADEAMADKPGRLIAITRDTQAVAGTWAALPSEVKSAPFDTHPGAFQSRGIDCKNNAGTPNTQFDLKADELVLRSADGDVVRLLNPGTITNNISTAGPAANGRDQAGAIGASSWVHFYWIWGPGKARASLSSAVAPPTGPTLPAGYTHWAYAGAIYLNGSSQLAKTRIKGSRAYYEAGVSVLSGGNSLVESTVSLSSTIPPNALAAILWGQVTNASGGGNNARVRYISGSDFVIIEATTNNSSQQRNALAVDLPNVSQQFFYQASQSTGTFDAIVLGYVLPNGGE